MLNEYNKANTKYGKYENQKQSENIHEIEVVYNLLPLYA